MSFPIQPEDELSTFCDRANLILYETWLSNIIQLHDREVILPADEHKIVYELISLRKRALSVYDLPIAEMRDGSNGKGFRISAYVSMQ